MSLAIIGGTGAVDLFEPGEIRRIETTYGQPSAAPCRVRIGQLSAWFLARHGRPHRIPPHCVNYRANIEALRSLGVRRVLALNAVGGIADSPGTGGLVIPDQVIDYTWGRPHTFSDGAHVPLKHIEFASPFDGPLRRAVLAAAGQADIAVHDGGCLAVTQGPRLETAAEVRRLARDGATLVGMTAMPEAALAREAGLDYLSLCIVANPAAGLGDEAISEAAIHAVLAGAMRRVHALLEALSVKEL
ncbi:MAG: S-methyl-5'-thioinosine phosphorylase [Pseudomonadota bacterium]|nr:MAG: S-methyl-5'-thioinosine phosphorylase [Pseudomonadota bacterium]